MTLEEFKAKWLPMMEEAKKDFLSMPDEDKERMVKQMTNEMLGIDMDESSSNNPPPV